MRLSVKGSLRVMIFVPALVTGAAQAVCSSSGSSWSVSSGAVERYWSDPVLRSRWAILIDCRHPNWPPRAVELGNGSQQPGLGRDAGSEVSLPAIAAESQVAMSQVKAGSLVELWSDVPVRIRLSGTTLNTAAVGERVRIRVGISGKALEGVLSGPHSVQLRFDAPARREP